ncbi:MAG: FecR family protein [Vicinamibacterales bacterium]
MTKLCSLAGALTLIMAAAAPAVAQDAQSAGRIKVASGTAFVVRQGAVIPAEIGQLVFAADGLRTGADGRVGVTLKDETRISLGPNSEARLDQFTYSPAESQFALVLRVVRGVAAYVSGRIAKLSPDSIRLETPAAIVGVRGTRVAIRVEPS